MTKTIERKFKKRISGVLQFICNYEDFQKILIGDVAAIVPVEKGSDFAVYFEGTELRKDSQNVFLHYHKRGEKPHVVEYNFPLEGKIRIGDLEKYKVEYYEVE